MKCRSRAIGSSNCRREGPAGQRQRSRRQHRWIDEKLRSNGRWTDVGTLMQKSASFLAHLQIEYFQSSEWLFLSLVSTLTTKERRLVEIDGNFINGDISTTTRTFPDQNVIQQPSREFRRTVVRFSSRTQPLCHNHQHRETMAINSACQSVHAATTFQSISPANAKDHMSSYNENSLSEPNMSRVRQRMDSDCSSSSCRSNQTCSSLESSASERSVRFSQHVRVHQHRLILGDNPSVSDGIPLTLDWEVEASVILDLDMLDDQVSTPRSPTKIPLEHRQVIAEATNPECLTRVQEEIQATKESRLKSMKDPSQPLWQRLRRKMRVPRMFRKKIRYAT